MTGYMRNQGITCQSIWNCNRPAEIKHMCRTCYNRQLMGRKVVGKANATVGTCFVVGCGRPETYSSTHTCHRHYHMLWRNKTRKKDRRCTIEGCEEVHYALGLCNKHYSHQYNHKDEKIRKWERQAGKCIVLGCSRPQKSNHMCETHSAYSYMPHMKEKLIFKEETDGDS